MKWNSSSKLTGKGGARRVIKRKENPKGRSLSAFDNSRQNKQMKPVKELTEDERLDRVQNFYPAISTQKRFVWQTDPSYFDSLLKMKAIEDSKIPPEALEEIRNKSSIEKLMSRTPADGFGMNCSMKRQYKERVRHEFNNAKRVIQPHVGEEEKPNPNNFDYYYQKFNCIQSPPKIKRLRDVSPRHNAMIRSKSEMLREIGRQRQTDQRNFGLKNAFKKKENLALVQKPNEVPEKQLRRAWNYQREMEEIDALWSKKMSPTIQEAEKENKIRHDPSPLVKKMEIKRNSVIDRVHPDFSRENYLKIQKQLGLPPAGERGATSKDVRKSSPALTPPRLPRKSQNDYSMTTPKSQFEGRSPSNSNRNHNGHRTPSPMSQRSSYLTQSTPKSRRDHYANETPKSSVSHFTQNSSQKDSRNLNKKIENLASRIGNLDKKIDKHVHSNRKANF